MDQIVKFTLTFLIPSLIIGYLVKNLTSQGVDQWVIAGGGLAILLLVLLGSVTILKFIGK